MCSWGHSRQGAARLPVRPRRQDEPPRLAGISDYRCADEIAASAAKFIIDTCYEQIDDVTRVASFARMMKWPELSEDQKNVLKPVDANRFEGWMVDHEGTTFAVVINHATLKGRPAEICQVSAPSTPRPFSPALRMR
jgi:hypothetical protein